MADDNTVEETTLDDDKITLSKTELLKLIDERSNVIVGARLKQKKLAPKPVEETTEDVSGSTDEIKEMKKAMKQLIKEREMEKEEVRQLTLKSSLNKKLTEAGISPQVQKAVSAMLLADQSVKYNQAGQLVFIKSASSAYEENEELSFDLGMNDWLQSPVAQHFLPPKTVAGTNSRSASLSHFNSPTDPKTQALTQASEELISGSLKRLSL